MNRFLWLLILPALFACKPHPKKLTAAELERKQTHEKTERLKWNRKTLVEDYDRVGSKNPLWDDDAREALSIFAEMRSGTDTEAKASMKKVLRKLNQAQCDDPLIKYLCLRYVLSQENETTSKSAKSLVAVTDKISSSGYSPIRKFYVALRASEYTKHINGKTPQVFYQLRDYSAQFLREALSDKTIPVDEAYDAASRFIADELWSEPTDDLRKAIEPMFKTWPDEPARYLIEAEFEMSAAWLARGDGYANSVSQEQRKQFKEHVDKCESALLKAWSLDEQDERIPTEMLEVGICKHYDKQKFGIWFHRAMELKPDNAYACRQKSRYLRPEWYGSSNDMLAFGRECVNSKWSGEVPLILADAHYRIFETLQDEQQRRDYWARPEVWSDIKASYDRFFELNPNAAAWHHNYARYAYWANQWETVNQQVALFTYTNYNYFGGREQFEKMVQLAKEHSAK